MIGQYVAKLGFELEGGWNEAPSGPARERLKGDGSVTATGSYYVGEIASPAFSDWARAIEFLHDGYPHVVNPTCGFHIHLSFTNMALVGFLGDLKPVDGSPHYQAQLFSSYERLGKACNLSTGHRLWTRLRGGNRYCQTSFNPGRQLVEHRDRYMAVNFMSLEKHGTVEIRVLPQFRDKNIAEKFLRTTVTVTDEYLRRQVAVITKSASSSVRMIKRLKVK